MSKMRSALSSRMDLGDLLESFVRSRDYIRGGARRIESQEELPLPLQAHTRQIEGVVWRAWDDGKHIRFVKAKCLSRESGGGLQVMFFGVTRMRITTDRILGAVVADEGGPLGVGVQKLAPNQAVLL